MTDANSALSNPVLNGPYDEPNRHFELGPNGPTGEIIEKRRPSEFFIPVPKQKRGRGKAAKQIALAVVGALCQRGLM